MQISLVIEKRALFWQHIGRWRHHRLHWEFSISQFAQCISHGRKFVTPLHFLALHLSPLVTLANIVISVLGAESSVARRPVLRSARVETDVAADRVGDII